MSDCIYDKIFDYSATVALPCCFVTPASLGQVRTTLALLRQDYISNYNFVKIYKKRKTYNFVNIVVKKIAITVSPINLVRG